MTRSKVTIWTIGYLTRSTVVYLDICMQSTFPSSDAVAPLNNKLSMLENEYIHLIGSSEVGKTPIAYHKARTDVVHIRRLPRSMYMQASRLNFLALVAMWCACAPRMLVTVGSSTELRAHIFKLSGWLALFGKEIRCRGVFREHGSKASLQASHRRHAVQTKLRASRITEAVFQHMQQRGSARSARVAQEDGDIPLYSAASISEGTYYPIDCHCW